MQSTVVVKETKSTDRGVFALKNMEPLYWFAQIGTRVVIN